MRLQHSRSTDPAPPPAPGSRHWRRIAQALDDPDDASIARRLRVARAHVAHGRAALSIPTPDAIRRAVERRTPALLTLDEELTLGRHVQGDDPELRQDARSVLAEFNQNLVWSVVNKWRTSGLDVDDLFGFGCEGLLRAIDKYDPERGIRFSTYAVGWIRQRISRALDDHRGDIRLPVHQQTRIRELHKTEARLVLELNRDPSDEEVAAAMGLSPDKVVAAREAKRLAAVSSLDWKIGEDEESTMMAIVAAPHDTADEALASAQAGEVRALLARLPERERLVIELRFGLDTGQHRTLDEVGKVLGCTRERARQIEANALRHLRTAVGLAPRERLPGEAGRALVAALEDELPRAGFGERLQLYERLAAEHGYKPSYVHNIAGKIDKDIRERALARLSGGASAAAD